MWRLACSMVYSAKWKMLAASTASALPKQDAVRQMVQRADAAGGDHRNAHRFADRAGQPRFETALGAVAVHAGQQDFARAVSAIRRAQATASMPVGLRPPWVKISQRGVRPAMHRLGVDGDHDALRTEACRRPRARIRGRAMAAVLIADFVGPGVQHPPHIVQRGCRRPRSAG
jgi:hypothetical protein